MLTDVDLVRLCAATYDPSYKDWDVWYDGTDPDGIIAGIKGNVVACQGTTDLRGWLRDLDALTYVPANYPELGAVHMGFDRGLDEFFQKISDRLSDDFYWTGHSLGAPHCELLAARYIAGGGRAARIASFAPPRAGCEQLRQFLMSVSKGYYKNRVDAVTNVPEPLPGFPFVHLNDFTMLDVAPAELDDDPTPWLDFNLPALIEGISFEDHHIELYVKGVEELEKS